MEGVAPAQVSQWAQQLHRLWPQSTCFTNQHQHLSQHIVMPSVKRNREMVFCFQALLAFSDRLSHGIPNSDSHPQIAIWISGRYPNFRHLWRSCVSQSDALSRRTKVSSLGLQHSQARRGLPFGPAGSRYSHGEISSLQWSIFLSRKPQAFTHPMRKNAWNSKSKSNFIADGAGRSGLSTFTPRPSAKADGFLRSSNAHSDHLPSLQW